MKKPFLIALFLTLVWASLQSQARADELPNAKFTGKTLINPNRTTASAESTGAAKANSTSKSFGADDVMGMYDVWFDLQQDRDGDGYFAQFEVFFDIDSRYSNTRIYVIGQLDNGTTTPLFQTAPYVINGASGADTYSAKVLLTDGYPSGQYSLTLYIYDAQTNALLMTWGPQQDGQMTQLFLEDGDRDVVSIPDIQVFEMAFTLLNDFDNDGYYTDADVTIDVDAPQQTRSLYASLYLIDERGEWIPLKNSSVFTVSGYSQSDRITLSFGLSSGFAPQHYRLGAKLYDAYSNNQLLTVTTPPSTPAYLESVEYDDSYSVTETVYVESHHGGSLGLLALLALLPLALRKKIA